MDDDLGTPAAVAVLFDAVREGNRRSPARPGAVRRAGARDARRARPRPGRPGLGRGGGDDEQLTDAVDVLVAGLLEQRAEARATKDFATADAIRDRIKAAGIEVEDTPDGPKWSLSSASHGRQQPAQGRDPQDRQGQPDRRVRRPGPARPRGQGPDAQGQGPARTTRPTRPRSAPRRPQAAPARGARPAPTPSGSRAATPWSRRCARACRSPACTSPRAPSATAGCARRSRSPPSAASACSRSARASSTG